jgi:hypothetical protein
MLSGCCRTREEYRNFESLAANPGKIRRSSSLHPLLTSHIAVAFPRIERERIPPEQEHP